MVSSQTPLPCDLFCVLLFSHCLRLLQKHYKCNLFSECKETDLIDCLQCENASYERACRCRCVPGAVRRQGAVLQQRSGYRHWQVHLCRRQRRRRTAEGVRPQGLRWVESPSAQQVYVAEFTVILCASLAVCLACLETPFCVHAGFNSMIFWLSSTSLTNILHVFLFL